MIGRQVYFRRYCPTGYGYCTLMLHEFADPTSNWTGRPYQETDSESPKAPDCEFVTAAKRHTLGMSHFSTGQQ